MARKFAVQAAVYSALRRKFKAYPGYKDTLDEAKEEYFIKSKHGKDMRRVHYKCADCGEMFKRQEVEVDHIEPVIPVEGIPMNDELPDFNVYIARLFCPEDNLQVLCKSCHKKKSAEEKKERAKYKKK